MQTKRNQRPRVVFVNRSFVINSKGELLLVKRSKNDKFDPGKWEIPGGKLDEGQDISHAIEREVFEETGLLVTPTVRIGYFESELLSSGPYSGMPYIIFIGVSKVDGGSVKISSEHDDYCWVNVKDFDKHEVRPETRKAFIVLKKNIISAIKHH